MKQIGRQAENFKNSLCSVFFKLHKYYPSYLQIFSHENDTSKTFFWIFYIYSIIFWINKQSMKQSNRLNKGTFHFSHFFGWTLLKTVAPLCISLWTDFSCAFLSSLCVKTECWLLLYMYEGQYYRLIKVAIFKAISFSSTTLCPITLISGQINDLQ